MATRLQLQSELENLLDSRNVYFQPPASIQLKYPCFVYSLEPGRTRRADNKLYLYDANYSLTYITRDAERLDTIKQILTTFEHCSHDRSFVNDNLYHEVFDLYY